MQIKFLKSIVEKLADKTAVPIIDLLVGKKHVNEFLIAKKLGLTINQTRNILYKLSDYGLVSFIRKKDKRKGWYIYFWTLNIYQSLDLLEKNLKKELENLEVQLKNRKERRYYICNTCSIEITEESALLNDFTCPECEEIYELSDNSEIIQQLEKSSSRTKKELDFVSAEREKEEDKIEKRKIKNLSNQKIAKSKVRKAIKKKANELKEAIERKLKREKKKKEKNRNKGKKVIKKKVKGIKKVVKKKLVKKLTKKLKKKK